MRDYPALAARALKDLHTSRGTANPTLAGECERASEEVRTLAETLGRQDVLAVLT